MVKENLPRLRAGRLASPPRVVLVAPEIPQNTGNIGRTTAALQCPLHLVEPLGFRTDEKAVRRAGLDYWPLVEMHRHPDFRDFRRAHPGARVLLFSAVGHRSVFDADFRAGDALVFGCESVGLPPSLLDGHRETTFALPTVGEVRSLNLANAVAVVLFEAYRQLGAFSPARLRHERP
ncbi:MAG: tRNA (cytidine(34)-2'-O)-methyltransferase [Myxococcota bacterium]